MINEKLLITDRAKKHSEILELVKQNIEDEALGAILVYACKRNYHYFFVSVGKNSIDYCVLIVKELCWKKTEKGYETDVSIEFSIDYESKTLSDFLHNIAEQCKHLRIIYDGCFLKKLYM